MIEVPWNGPSVIVPAAAIEALHKFNHNYNHVVLIQCRDCRFGSAGEAVISGNWQHGNCGNPRFRGSGIHRANARAKGFCAWGEPKEIPCQKTDEETAASADAPICKKPGDDIHSPMLKLGA